MQKNKILREFKIGAALALSGTAAPSGEGERGGIEMAVNEINQANLGLKINVVYEDTQSSNLGTLNAINKLNQ